MNKPTNWIEMTLIEAMEAVRAGGCGVPVKYRQAANIILRELERAQSENKRMWTTLENLTNKDSP